MTEATVCLTVDFDAVSPWLHMGDRDSPVQRSRGRFGAEVGAPRMLDVLDRHDVPSTWFIPGHTIESFPEACGDVVDAGHEIAHHGWSHRSLPSFESEAAERRDIARGIDAIYDLTGEKPDGFRTPDGGFSGRTKRLLAEFGFVWDSSDTAHDFRPYMLRDGEQVRVNEPYERGEPTDIVEIPYLWHRDDWMQLFPVVSGPEWVAYSTEGEVFDRWTEEFRWMHDNVEDGVYTLLLHPQCAGRVPFLTRLEAFIEEVEAMEGTRFVTVGTVASEF